MRVETYAGIHDVLSVGSQRDTILLLPTLLAAIDFWPRYLEAAKDVAGEDALHWAKSHIYFRETRRTIRLWVPYDREPTMHMDHHARRAEKDWYMITPYHRADVRL